MGRQLLVGRQELGYITKLQLIRVGHLQEFVDRLQALFVGDLVIFDGLRVPIGPFVGSTFWGALPLSLGSTPFLLFACNNPLLRGIRGPLVVLRLFRPLLWSFRSQQYSTKKI